MPAFMYFIDHHIRRHYILFCCLEFLYITKVGWSGYKQNKPIWKYNFERRVWLYSEEDILKLVHVECNQCVVSNSYQFLGQAVPATVILLSYMILLTHVANFIKFLCVTNVCHIIWL
jgi:hypothetical protein